MARKTLTRIQRRPVLPLDPEAVLTRGTDLEKEGKSPEDHGQLVRLLVLEHQEVGVVIGDEVGSPGLKNHPEGIGQDLVHREKDLGSTGEVPLLHPVVAPGQDRETVRREGEDHAQPPLAAVRDLGLDPEDQVGGEIGQGFSILHFITNFHWK